MLPLVVSFYTERTPYQLDAQRLEESCRTQGVECAIRGIPSFGSWEMNCAYKPLFLLEELEKRGRPLLWVDADAIFLKPLDWCGAFESDFAARVRSEVAESHPSKVMSNTLFVSPQSAAFLKAWVQGCLAELQRSDRTETFWDQTVLRDLFLAPPPGMRLEALPASLAVIHGHPVDEALAPDPVILHYQASHAYKPLVDGFFSK